jgi:hypothetical protein
MAVISDDVVELEDQGWRALATSGEAAAEFYGRVLDDRVVMVLPGGMRIDDRAAAVEAMSGAAWAWYRLENILPVPLTDDVVTVAYTATAQRGQDDLYTAQMSSTYVRRSGGWRMAFHQQTPS